MNRQTALDRLRAADETFDMLVVGGGASGLGAAVDAAARGYRVALIEQADFATGTSSRSTFSSILIRLCTCAALVAW